MKETFSQQQTPQHTKHASIRSISQGSRGIAIAPPGYGIEFVDRAASEVTQEHGRNYQPPALDVKPEVVTTIQKYAAASSAESNASVKHQVNKTGLPNKLKSGVENLSGLSMDDVRVHYNSSRPARLQAFAYTQGADIHVAPGQERHVPHEAWHVVQQKQGRVKPTMQAKGVAINDDSGLEREADVMGARASRMKTDRASFLTLSGNTSNAASQRVTQMKHSFFAMILHHAPKQVADNIDVTNKITYSQHDVIGSRRGEIRAKPETEYAWDFAGLANRLDREREQEEIPKFPIFINANWMVSPGYEEAPRTYDDANKNIYSISSVWGMQYKIGNDPSSDYGAVLNHWKARDDANAGSRRSRFAEDAPALGEGNAKKLLRFHSKEKVAAARNDVIPHRGLRNYFFKDPWIMRTLRDTEAEPEVDYLHLITLDDDTSLNLNIISELMDRNEEALSTKELNITATDYVYERDNLFEWFAGALDKVGRKKLEQAGIDAYPAEPGLTISYLAESGDQVRDRFLADDLFGPEYPGAPSVRDFKKLVESRQSVEGKNIREKWRRGLGDDRAQITRTTNYLSVRESEAQKHDHGRTLAGIAQELERDGMVSAERIQSLITSDSYHSLTPDRNNEAIRKAQREVVAAGTEILNRVLKEKQRAATQEKRKLLEAELKRYMG